MTNARIPTSKAKEQSKMKKYIVEAPEPKSGQKISSGGIRENGKLVSQFKNPVPYEEPTLSSSTLTQRSYTELIHKEQAKSRKIKAGMYLFNLAWEEFGEPLLRSSLRILGNKIISKIEDHSEQYLQNNSSLNSVVIDVEADEIENVYNDDKFTHLSM